MAFDGLILNAVVAELNNSIINGKIQKIYEPTENEVLLGIYANGSQYALSINVSSNFYSTYLTTHKKENPLFAPNFCMLLRKHLIGYKITSISTPKLERIMIISLAGNDENNQPITKKLVVELMGKHSNVLLLNSEDYIIDSLKHFSKEDGASRNIMPRYKYTLPESDKSDIFEFKQFENSLNNSTLSDFFVNHFTGISKTFINFTIKHLSSSMKELEINTLNKDTYNFVANYILSLIEDIQCNNVECISLENDYTLISCQNSKQLQVNYFLDDYYSNKQQTEQFLSYKNSMLNFISAKLKKISKKLSGIDQKLLECSHMEDYKLYGELITSYLYKIPNTHTASITLANYYDNNKELTIPLDIAFSPADNAKKYFKKYHKLKNTLDIVKEQKKEIENEIAYLESIVYEIESAKTIKNMDAIYEEIQDSFSRPSKQSNKNKTKKQKSKKQSTSLEPISYKIEDFKVLIGRNNKQNDELTFKIASKEDIWFHVKDIQGSHTVLVTNNKVPSQEVINKCAALAAFHSKASQSSNVPVDYTLVKNIKKPSKAKPGMVIYTNQKTVNVQPQSK